MPYIQMMDERLRFLNIDHNTISELQKAKAILEPAIDEMLDRFYSHILGEPDLRALFVDKDTINRARSAQKDHWLKTLFRGKYDKAYFEKTAQIGRAHARIGLTLNWYIGAYCQMLNQFIELISRRCSVTGKPSNQIIQAVSKAIFLDMDLVIHCYLDAKDDAMLNILHRATNFTADVTVLIDNLSVTASQIKATADTLSAEAGGQHRIDELQVQAEQLSRQTAQLDERLKELQNKDKLYIVKDADIQESGLLTRLKAMLKK